MGVNLLNLLVWFLFFGTIYPISVTNLPLCVCPEVKCPVCEDCSAHRSIRLSTSNASSHKDKGKDNGVQLTPPKWSIVEDTAKRTPETIKIGISQMKKSVVVMKKEIGEAPIAKPSLGKKGNLIEKSVTNTASTPTPPPSTSRRSRPTRVSLKPILVGQSTRPVFQRLITAKWAHTFRWPTTEARVRTIAPKTKWTIKPIMPGDYDLREEEEILKRRGERVVLREKEDRTLKATTTIPTTTTGTTTTTTTTTTAASTTTSTTATTTETTTVMATMSTEATTTPTTTTESTSITTSLASLSTSTELIASDNQVKAEKRSIEEAIIEKIPVLDVDPVAASDLFFEAPTSTSEQEILNKTGDVTTTMSTPRVILSSESPLIEKISPSGYASSALFGSQTHTFDPTRCNTGEWAELLEKEMIQNDATASKQKISEKLGDAALHSVSVLCSKTTISFRLVATKYCQMTAGDVTCLIFQP